MLENPQAPLERAIRVMEQSLAKEERKQGWIPRRGEGGWGGLGGPLWSPA